MRIHGGQDSRGLAGQRSARAFLVLATHLDIRQASSHVQSSIGHTTSAVFVSIDQATQRFLVRQNSKGRARDVEL